MADGIDWGSVVGGMATGIPLGGLALKLAFDSLKEKDARLADKDTRIAAMEESFRKKLEEKDKNHTEKLDEKDTRHAEIVKEVRDAHERDLRESAEQQRLQRENSERLLERVLEGLGQLAVIRAGGRAPLLPPGGGGSQVREPGGGGGR